MQTFKHFNLQLTGSLCLIALSVFNFGFDNQGFATGQAMDAFTKDFGDRNAVTGKYELNTVWLSLFSSLIYVGFATGIIVGSLSSARWGRRKVMFAMSAYEIMSATVIVTSQNRYQIMIGRILNYVYIGIELTVVPVFQAEIVPTSARGFVVSTYQLSLIFGGLVMNCICLATSNIEDSRAYRIPFGLFYIIPSIIMAGILFVPESPRWLLIKGRREEAMASLKRLRKGVMDDEEIEREFNAIALGLEEEPEQGNFKELFRGTNTKRTITAAGVHLLQNLCGQNVVSKFGSLIVKSMNTISPFIMVIIFAITNLVFVFIGMTWSDKIGRRPLLLLSASTQAVALLILASIGHTGWPLQKTYEPVAITFLCVLTAGFSIGFAPLANVVGAEVVALRLRDRTQMIACCMNVVANFASDFSLPYLLNAPYANLHLQVGWVFAPIGIFAVVFVWFMVPECKGKSLEQIDHLFHIGLPVSQFKNYKFADVYTEETDIKTGDEQVEHAGGHIRSSVL